LDNLQENIRSQTQERSEKLRRALQVAEDFNRDYLEVIRGLRDIQDNLLSQDSPGVDTSTVAEQQKELQAIKDDLDTVRPTIADVRQRAEELEQLCGIPGRMELQKNVEDLDTALEDIQEGIRDRDQELGGALEKSERFDQTLQAIMSWLPPAEQRMDNMAPIAADPRSVRIQIAELKVLNVQVKPRLIDIQNLNQFASDLKNASPVTAESLSPQVQEINERWNKLLKKIQDREVSVCSIRTEHRLAISVSFSTSEASATCIDKSIFSTPSLFPRRLL